MILVLSNEKKRYIYDKFGRNAVDECWDLVQRSPRYSHKTADEIIEEWMRVKREKEFLQRSDDNWNSEGHLVVTLNATPIWDVEEKLQYGPVPWSERMPEVSGISITQTFNVCDLNLLFKTLLSIQCLEISV